MADQSRYEALIRKRTDAGLSDVEADELGRMMAEREGKPYANARLAKARGGDAGGGESEPEADRPA